MKGPSPRRPGGATIAVRFEHSEGWLVAAVEGNLDAVATPALAGEFEARDHQALAVDLSGVTFVDSSGVAFLLDLKERHDRVVLVAPSGVVRRVLSVLGLLGEFEVIADREGLS